MSNPPSPLPVPPDLQRGAHKSREEWLESGLFAVELICRTLKREDLVGVELLDVGCGTKVVKTLLDHSKPVGHYAGIDASSQVIEWLKANVSDPRFEFHHLDAHNEMYNPDGTDLAAFDFLPVGDRQFDFICLFSVFTHLAPHDYVAMLRLLRRHAKPETKLLFSLFLRDVDREAAFVEAGLNSPDPDVRKRIEAALAQRAAQPAPSEDARFVDMLPGRPLVIARYEPDYALELISGTGWKVLSVHPPERHIQHYLICAAE